MADVMDVDDVLFGSLPDGMDMPVGGKELAQYQLEMFDIEVEARIEQMEAEIKKLIAKFEREFSVSMFKIPKDVREMKMGYLMDEFGGDISAVKKKDIHKKMEDAKAMPPPPPPSTARRSKRGAKATEPDTGGGTAKKLRSSREVSKVSSEAEAPSSVRRSSRRATQSTSLVAETPATVKRSTRPALAQVTSNDLKTPLPATKKGKVPAMTPAFDPRLPATPLVRLPRQGESVMSAGGSPLLLDARRAISMAPNDRSSIITIPLSGKIVQLSTTDELDQISKNLSKKNKREAADKIQEMMDQLRDVHARLQAM
eukprot:m.44379 g.44379  ORF g.44379 m.44379 type:complete len:313 (-) comp8530_c0_seq1:1441-2379(-)